MQIRTLITIAAVVVAAASASAQQRRPLPPFNVTMSDGSVAEGSTLAIDGTWLLVYVQPRCTPCDALLAHIDSDERPAASRIVVVGGGMDQAAVAELAAKYPNLAAGRWVADPQREAVQALGIKAGPTVFGLRAMDIEWRLAGSVRESRELESILFTWLEKK
jgi:hypothetical protein